MTIPSQIRAARALLGISVDDLSVASGVPTFIILQIEADTVTEADGGSLVALAEGLTELGVTFIADGDGPTGGPGVRLTARHREEGDGMRPDMLNASNDD